MQHSTSAPNERVLRVTQLAKLSFNHLSVVLTADVFQYFYIKPGIYGGRVRVWANEWDVFHCTPEVVAVAGLLWIYFVVCFFSVWWDFVFFFFVFFTSNAHGLLQVRGNLASCTSLLVMRQGRGSEATEAVFCLQGKKASS